MASFAIAGERVDDFSQKGFRLAYFIVRDRSSAIQIVTQAWNKLGARCKYESKRTYWRDKYLKRGVTKISRTDSDTLQWLIYFESESYEKRQEQCGVPTTQVLIVRYIKSLVQATTTMSSFYVAVGIHRLVHDYGTAEIQRVYEAVTERYLGGDEYRRVKRFLMHKLTLRFGSLLRTVTLAHGEVRFEPLEDQSSWTELVRECLDAFVPWSTRGHCLVLADFGRTSATLGRERDNQDSDRLETNRCHAFIDPVCFSRLAQALGLDPPENRLALPKFFLENPEGGSGLAPEPSDLTLTSTEKEAIHASVAAESARRKKCVPQMLRILVDGTERDRIVLNRALAASLEIEEGAKLVEIWTRDRDGDLLLATHLVSYSDAHRIAPSAASFAAGGFTLSLVVRVNDAGAPALLNLTADKPSPLARAISFFLFPRSLQYAALALLFIGMGWTLAFVHYRRILFSQPVAAEGVQQRINHAESASTQASANSQPEANLGIVSRELLPYDLTRGNGTSASSVIALPAHSTLLKLNLPFGAPAYRSLRASLKLLPEQNEIVREKLAPTMRRERFVVFSVPVTLLLDGKDYLVELSGTNSAGTFENVHIFLFRVVKEGE